MNLRKTLAINSIGILNYLLKILRAINARTLSVHCCHQGKVELFDDFRQK